MYPDFLASPELALDCLRQEHRVRSRNADQCQKALLVEASQPRGHSSLLGIVKAILVRPYLRLKPKPELVSITASSR